jgi:hypothetical protein
MRVRFTSPVNDHQDVRSAAEGHDTAHMQGLQAEQHQEVQPPLGLAMIVKNEADYIAQTLLSVKPHIDYWTVVDTGALGAAFLLLRTPSLYSSWLSLGCLIPDQ